VFHALPCGIGAHSAYAWSPSPAMQSLRHFLLAVQFFSRIPVAGGWPPGWAGARPCSAPAPGICRGGLAGGPVGRAAAGRIALAAAHHQLVAAGAALISTAGTLWLTGGFHEDGLADVADGLGGLVPPERALEIMKDSASAPMA
jgi:adenosylcobinamide-GDP ribazoletransferase